MYLLVRVRKIRIFGAVDLHSDAGWTELKAAVAGMPRQAFGGAPASLDCGADCGPSPAQEGQA